MRRFNKSKAAAFLGVASLTVAMCSADTFVDTIGNGSKLGLGKELARSLSIGYSEYPWSGDFTGVRPTNGSQPANPLAYTYTDHQSSVWGVTHRGTTGVKSAQILVGNQPTESAGRYAGWIVQPIKPAASGFVTGLDFVAEYRTPAFHVPEFFGGPVRSAKAYIGLIDAPTTGTALPSNLWSSSAPVEVDLANCNVGKMVHANVNKPVTAGSTYWVVIAPESHFPGDCSTDVLDYANIAWAYRKTASDIDKALTPLYSGANGVGDFVPVPNTVLGIRVTGLAQQPQSMTVADARNAEDGTPVSLAGVAITAKTGAIGPDFFYVEQPDRAAGLRVVGTTGLPVGERVTVIGTMTTVGLERAVITLVDVSSTGENSALPAVGMSSQTIGGRTSGKLIGPDGGTGVNNVGLLVRAWGKVTPGTGNEFTIADGAGSGVLCRAASGITVPTTGYVSVGGIATVEQAGSVKRSVVLIRDQQDIKAY